MRRAINGRRKEARRAGMRVSPGGRLDLGPDPDSRILFPAQAGARRAIVDAGFASGRAPVWKERVIAKPLHTLADHALVRSATTTARTSDVTCGRCPNHNSRPRT